MKKFSLNCPKKDKFPSKVDQNPHQNVTKTLSQQYSGKQRVKNLCDPSCHYTNVLVYLGQSDCLLQTTMIIVQSNHDDIPKHTLIDW